MRISDWSSDVCSSDLRGLHGGRRRTMHLNLSAFRRHTAAAALLAPVLLSGLAIAQQAPADRQKAVQSQPDPHVPPPAQPIDPGKAAARDMQDKAQTGRAHV